MRIMMTGGHIILLFIISSSFLFLHSSAAASFLKGIKLPISASPSSAFSQKQLEKIKEIKERVDDLNDILEIIIEKRTSDQSKEKLQATVEKIQRTYGLPFTGKIDDATVSFINRSRCGVPDYSFVSTLRWPWQEEKKELTYAFYNGAKVTAPLRAVFSRAFRKWENVTGLSFNETASFDGSDIGIAFLKMNKTDVAAVSGGFDKTRRVMIFEVNEEWGPLEGDMAAGDVDFETAVMHQIGHMVGLGHTTADKAAVMFPFMDSGKRKKDFATGETLRIQQLFNITSNAATSNGGNTSTGGSGGTPAGDGCSVGPTGWVLSLGIALLSLCL